MSQAELAGMFLFLLAKRGSRKLCPRLFLWWIIHPDRRRVLAQGVIHNASSLIADRGDLNVAIV